MKPYKDLVWVYACVGAIARNVAQVPITFLNAEEQLLPDRDPLNVLFKKPNPLMSGYELFVSTETHLQLSGNSLWIPVPRNDGKGIAEIWNFGGHCFKPNVTKKGEFFRMDRSMVGSGDQVCT